MQGAFFFGIPLMEQNLYRLEDEYADMFGSWTNVHLVLPLPCLYLNSKCYLGLDN